MKPLFLLTLLLIISTLRAQEDFGWWNARHAWDGFSQWQDYLITAPAFFGPNALEVPPVKNGRLDSTLYFAATLGHHESSGDRTQDLRLEAGIPLAGNVGFRLWWVAGEYYAMDTLTRDARVARDFDGKGWASGDLYLGTYVQLLKNHHRWPDLLLTVNLRTASGNRLTAARYLDSPGYFFDLSAGKTLPLGVKRQWRPHATLGFYVWQTNEDNHYQNDALLYAIGTDVEGPTAHWRLALTGYRGYLDNGDRPTVLRLEYQKKGRSRWQPTARLQWGLHDFDYLTVRLGMRFGGI